MQVRSSQPPNDNSLHTNVIHHTDRLDQSTAHHFIQAPKSNALQCLAIGLTPPKVPPSMGHRHPHVILVVLWTA